MISVNISNVRAAEVAESGASYWVTLRFGSNDRVVIHTTSRTQAYAIALAVNGDVDAALTREVQP